MEDRKVPGMRISGLRISRFSDGSTSALPIWKGGDKMEDQNYDLYDDYYDPSMPYTCPRCDGDQFIMACVDDLCRSTGECFYAKSHHGAVSDGCFRRCPMCKGTGEVADEEPGS